MMVGRLGRRRSGLLAEASFHSVNGDLRALMISATARRIRSPISHFLHASHLASPFRQSAICQHLTDHEAQRWAGLIVWTRCFVLMVGHRSPTAPHLEARAFSFSNRVVRVPMLRTKVVTRFDIKSGYTTTQLLSYVGFTSKMAPPPQSPPATRASIRLSVEFCTADR